MIWGLVLAVVVAAVLVAIFWAVTVLGRTRFYPVVLFLLPAVFLVGMILASPWID